MVKIPPPSTTDDVQSIGYRMGTTQMSPNMLQMIETLISISPEKHLLQKFWTRDSLIELIEVIENTDNMVNKKDKKYRDITNEDYSQGKSGNSFLKKPEDMEPVMASELLSKNDEKDTTSNSNSAPSLETDEGTNLLDENRFITPSKENQDALSTNNIINENSTDPTSYISSNMTLRHEVERPEDDSSNELREAEKKNKKGGLFETVIKQKFKAIKSSIVSEADVITFYLNKCNENLELTKNLVDLTDNPELKSQFFAKRVEVMMLAMEIKISLEETQKLLNFKITEETVTLNLFKELVELVVDGEKVKDYLEKYTSFIETTKKLIEIGKESYISIESNIDTIIQEENVSVTDIDRNESEEQNHSYNNEDFSQNIFDTNSWKADVSSYQVDDRERVSPVSKMDAGPLFTDKLRLKTEAVIDLLPTALVSSENPFNPQALLERIRNNPKYFRNSTWTTQYDLLTCMPQPYLNRIMLSGEFYNN